MKIAPVRRLMLAFLALAASAFLCRHELATALITRGDEFLTNGRPQNALVFYSRALLLDPKCEVAADRSAFVGLEIHSSRSLRDAANVADRFLLVAPTNSALLLDRALIANTRHEYTIAYRDFSVLASSMHDERFWRLAGRAAHPALISKPKTPEPQDIRL
ncbi:MAG TPA: tetratricopeptide repeat protein [Candidatus Baltobacteraceae bacterium]|jgi:hypothetical protein|nr:tetratricopeptide repeat protein [Candidatus Baltobacteraceae bacterium]